MNSQYYRKSYWFLNNEILIAINGLIMNIIEINKCKSHLNIYVVHIMKTFFSILICCNPVSAHFDEAYSTRGNESVSYNDWQKYLADDLGIDSISIPGTHDSGSLYGGDIVRTQSSITIRNKISRYSA